MKKIGQWIGGPIPVFTYMDKYIIKGINCQANEEVNRLSCMAESSIPIINGYPFRKK